MDVKEKIGCGALLTGVIILDLLIGIVCLAASYGIGFLFGKIICWFFGAELITGLIDNLNNAIGTALTINAVPIICGIVNVVLALIKRAIKRAIKSAKD